MKKLLIVFAILLLSGCSNNQEEYVNEIDVDVVVNVTEWVAIDENTHQFTIIREEDLLETLKTELDIGKENAIKTIELLLKKGEIYSPRPGYYKCEL